MQFHRFGSNYGYNHRPRKIRISQESNLYFINTRNNALNMRDWNVARGVGRGRRTRP